MRMWMVNPRLMCRNHLLGEHVELHMLMGCLRRDKNINGFLEQGLVDPPLIRERHEQLAQEMESRGYRHQSPIGDCGYSAQRGKLDPRANLVELSSRCATCRRLIEADGA